MMDSSKAKYLDLSLGTMSLALRLVRASMVIALMAIPAFVVTLGLGVVVYGGLLAVVGVLLVAAGCSFWFGVLRSLLAAKSNADRWLLGPTFVAVPILIAGSVLAVPGGFLRPNQAEQLALESAAFVFLAGAMCWLIFLRRQADRYKDSWVSRQTSSLLNRMGATITLCVLGEGARSWHMSGMAARNLRMTDPLIWLAILPWLAALLLAWVSIGQGIRVLAALRSTIRSTAKGIIPGD